MSTDQPAESLRCLAVVRKRDTYRVAGDGRRKFRMHYNKVQCSRRATCPDGLCRQHAAMGGVALWKRP